MKTVMPHLPWYDWLVVNTSAGKDSQAMLDRVCRLAEGQGILDRVVAVHCDLAEEEWPGTRELAQEQAPRREDKNHSHCHACTAYLFERWPCSSAATTILSCRTSS